MRHNYTTYSLSLFALTFFVGCAGDMIHEVGDIHVGGSAAHTTSIVATGGAGSNVPSASGGSGGKTFGATGGNAGQYWFPAGGAHLNPQGGAGGSAQTTQPPPIGPDDVELFSTWTTFMGPYSFRMALRNTSTRSIFIRCEGDWARYENGRWVAKTTACANASGSLIEILPGKTYYSSSLWLMANYGQGLYRLQNEYWVGCSMSGSCTSNHAVTSRPVQVLVRAGDQGAAGAAGASGSNPGASAAGGPGELHANCSDTEPCPSQQTAVGNFYASGAGESCSCEIPCSSNAAPACPSGTSCQFMSDGAGSLCY